MATDNRDWYRAWWRKKTGYVERARFRTGAADHKRVAHARAWRANWMKLGAFVLCLVVLRLILRSG